MQNRYIFTSKTQAWTSIDHIIYYTSITRIISIAIIGASVSYK